MSTVLAKGSCDRGCLEVRHDEQASMRWIKNEPAVKSFKLKRGVAFDRRFISWDEASVKATEPLTETRLRYTNNNIVAVPSVPSDIVPMHYLR